MFNSVFHRRTKITNPKSVIVNDRVSDMIRIIRVAAEPMIVSSYVVSFVTLTPYLTMTQMSKSYNGITCMST